MGREHAVAERPSTAADARHTRPPPRETRHDHDRRPERVDDRGASTRDRLTSALLGERPAVTTRDRVAAGARADRPSAATTRRGPPRVFTKLHVTDPTDAWEIHADAVAALVDRGPSAHGAPTAPSGPPHGPEVVTTEAAQALVEKALVGSGGAALPVAVRRRVEPILQVDLSQVRVRQDDAAATAARALGARAFTVGTTIHLGPGASAHDVGLMAHEAAHVVHQGLAPARAPPVVMRSVSEYLPDVSITDVIPDSVLDSVRSLVRAIPGYTALTYVVGQDLLTGESVHVDVDALLDAVLTHGPFGPAVATVLRALSIAQEIYATVSAAFSAHDLTLTRFTRDIGAAWDELSVTNGVDGNVAVVRRYVDAILADLRAMVSDLVDQVLALVRRAVVAVAEPFVQRPSVAPVWNLAKEVLHYDPLLGVEVQVPTVQIIADFLTLIGQTERLEQMRQRGTLQETADWLDTQVVTFAGIVTEVGALFSQAWDAIQPANLPDLLDTLPALADRAVGVVRRIAEFATTLIAKVLELVRKALLGWLSEHAHQVPGFHMLTVIIGRNPFTGDAVPRTPANLIKGFITLLPHGEATYDELEKSGVVTEAAGRIEAAMVRLGISLDMVVSTFRGVWDSLSLDDLLQPVAAFQRVVAQFGEPLGRIIEFVGVVLQVVVELILRLMNFPTELLQHVISNAMQAIADIRRDPVAFLRNVMQALKLGFTSFFDHIGTYLLDGLVAWLFRGLGQIGIRLPSDFSLKSVIGLVLDVLGLSVEHLWTKLGEHIGPDRVQLIRRAIDTIGGAWQFIADVQREGLSAIWRYVEGQLSNLWQMLLDAALSWIERVVVQTAVTKLLSFLDPTGIMAVINSAIAIFNAVQSAIEYVRDLLQVLDRYVSTLAAVAAGNVVPGAQMLEQGLAAIIPIAIGFLANQVGLGNVPEKIVEIIGGLRRLVDQALDWLIEQALRLGRAALDALGLGQQQPASTADRPVLETFEISGQKHEIYAHPSTGDLVVASGGTHPVSGIDQLHALNREYKQLPRGATQRQRLDVLDKMAALITSDPSLVALLTGQPAGGLGLDTAVGDSVLIRRNGRGGDILGVHVVAVQQVMELSERDRVASVGGIRVQHPERGQIYMPYTGCGDLTDPTKSWQKEPGGKPALVGFAAHGGPGGGGHARIGVPLTTGAGASIPPSLQIVIGYGPPGIWIKAGHLVAREFGGPGSYSTGNIAPMTFAANQTKAGMRGIEMATSRAVAADPSGVFDYSATASYAAAQIPPVRVAVMVTKIWPPGSSLPVGFPSVPYDVDNTV